MQSENKDLQKKNADLNVLYLNKTKSRDGPMPPGNSGPSKHTKKGNHETDLDEDDRIGLHACKFGVMNELFVHATSFLVENPGCKPYTADCYDTAISAAKAVIAELFRVVPNDLHERMISHTSFRDTVSYIRIQGIFANGLIKPLLLVSRQTQ